MTDVPLCGTARSMSEMPKTKPRIHVSEGQQPRISKTLQQMQRLRQLIAEKLTGAGASGKLWLVGCFAAGSRLIVTAGGQRLASLMGGTPK